MKLLSLSERIRKAAACEEPDQVPAAVSVPASAYAKFAGISQQDYYFNPEKALAATHAFQRRFPNLFLKGGFKVAYRNEPLLSGLGYRINWEEIGPRVDRASLRLEEIKIPDPDKDGMLPKVLDDLIYFARHTETELKEIRGDLLWVAAAGGPMGSLGDLAGYSQLFEMMYEQPKLLHELLERYTQASIVWVEAQERALASAGVKPGIIFLVDEALPLVSPGFAQEFFLPYVKRIFSATHARIKVFHCDNDVTHIPEIMREMGANVYDFNFSPAARLKKQLAGKLCLTGNLPVIEILQDGNPAQVEKASREIILQAGPGGGLILSPAGSINPNIRWENLDAMATAAQKYGRYPLPAGPDLEEEKPVTFKRAQRIQEQEKALDSNRILDRLARLALEGKVKEVTRAVGQALDLGIAPKSILFDGLGRGLALANEKYFLKLAFLPEITMANKALEEALRVLSPHFSGEETKGRIVIGTVQGNIMESGVNLIAAMLRAEGFEVTNLGVSVSPERFVKEAARQQVQIIALGVYTSERSSMVKQVAQLVQSTNLACKILVGGKGINTKKARELGAHAFARDGYDAVEKVKELLAMSETRTSKG